MDLNNQSINELLGMNLQLKSFDVEFIDPIHLKAHSKWFDKIMDVRRRLSENQYLFDKINAGGVSYTDLSTEEKTFIEWANNLPTSTIRERALMFEILNEIDRNVSIFKVERERDYYLTRISDDSRSTAWYFKLFLVKHPGYDNNKRFEQNGHLHDWRKLMHVRYRHPLEKFFLNALVLEEVMLKVAEYAESKKAAPDIIIGGTELEAFNHRLLLFYKLGLFEPLYQAHYNHLGAGNFTKLIANILGVPSTSIDGFRAEIRKLINELEGQQTKGKRVITGKGMSEVVKFLAEIGLTNYIM